MTQQERLETLKKRLTPEMQAAVQAAILAGRLPRSAIGDLSVYSLEALKNGQSLESTLDGGMALDNLEAIVALVGRPPLLVSNDQVLLEPMPDLPAETPSLIKGVEKWLPSVGRIEFFNHQMIWGGTGWVVEHRGKGALVVTNRHVAGVVAKRRADGSAVFLRAPHGARYGAAIDFAEEVDSKAGDLSRTAPITRVEYLADDTGADVALLLIEAADFALPDPFALVEDVNKVAQDDLVALIGFPAYDSRNDANAQRRYFRDLYEVKRFAPGRILQPPGNGILTYDCTSLGGNSGSPLIRLDDGKVIGLHFSGLYGKYNAGVSASTLHDLLKGHRPVSILLDAELHHEARDGSHPASHFNGREGFDSDFLGQSIVTPWPGLPAHLAASLARPSDNPPHAHELRYTHFGVKYCARLKLPLVTAVNIDGAAAVRIKRGDDKWFVDGRIPADIQLNSKHFNDAEIDRGHMVRREDPNWGSPAEALLANNDTFHYVNAAAQHSRLNQGSTLWLGLENYILDSARTHGFKACVFTGPILRAADDLEEEIIIDGAVVAQEFWKLVVTLDAERQSMHATAYVLSQGQLIRSLLEKRSKREALEGMVLGAYRTFQVAIADLAQATGYDFSAYTGADPLAVKKAVQDAVAQGEPVFLPISDMTDIVL